MIDEQQVALKPPEEDKSPGFTVGGGNLPTLAYASAMTDKFHFGLNNILSMDKDEIFKHIREGNEDQLRIRAASTADQLSSQARMKRIVDNPELALLELPSKPTNPNTVAEAAWAHTYLTAFRDDDSPLAKEMDETIPEDKKNILDIGHEAITRGQIVNTVHLKAQHAQEQQSYVGYGVDFLKSLFPFYSQLKETGTVGFFGENLQKEADRWLRMPLDQFQKDFPEMMDKLIADNPQAALRLLHAIQGMSLSERHLDNIMGVVDVSMVPGVPTLARKLFLQNTMRGVAKDAIRGTALRDSPGIAATKAVGDNLGAATGQIIEDLGKEMAGNTEGYINRVWNTLTTNLRGYKDEMAQHWGNTSRELLTRLQNGMDEAGSKARSLIMNRIYAERTALKFAGQDVLDRLSEELQERVNAYTDAMQDWTGPHEDPLTHAFHYEAHVGRTNGTLFDKLEQAKAEARKRNVIDPDIRRIGNKYEYVIKVAVPENHPLIRDLVLNIPDALPNHSWLNAFLGMIRNPSDTMSEHQMLNRVAGSYAPNEFFTWLRSMTEDIQGIQGFRNRKLFKDFEDLVKSGQQELDDQGRLGKWYKGAADINAWYLRTKDRLAEDSEIAAYFAFKKVVEVDRIMREIMMNTNMQRFGAKNYQLRYFKSKKTSEPTLSPWFNGTKINPSEGFPQDFNHTGVLTVTQNQIKGKKLSVAMYKSLNESFMQGKVIIIRPFNPYQTELREFARSGDEPFRYIIVDSSLFEERDLQFNSLPNRGGGHFEYLYDHYAKEAKFIKSKLTDYYHYVGDNTLHGVSIRALGHEWAKIENAKRALMRAGKLDEAQKLHETHMPDESWTDYYNQFVDRKGPDGGFIPKRLDMNSDVYIVPNNKMISDIDDKLFEQERFKDAKGISRIVDGTRSYSDANISKIQFTGERDVHDLTAIDNVGSRHNPVFKYSPAEKLAPLPMMNRGMTNLINNFVMDDIKMSAMEAWAKQAQKYLKDNIARDVDAAPLRVFYSASLNSFKNVDQKEVANLMWNKNKIDVFVGVPSNFDTFLHSAGQALADSIYGKIGPKGALVSAKVLPYLKDPFRAMRTLVFDAKVGLFSPAQFFVHATTYSTLLGVAGLTKAMPGTYGAFLHLWALMNPHILEHLDEKASHSLMRIPGSSHWRPGEWMEAFNLSRTGFLKSEHEHAMMDSAFRNQIVRTGMGNFLDWGRMFFKGGLASVRTAAWYTAYREFRDEAKWAKGLGGATAKIGNKERLMILDRADTLSHQMSRAHSTLLNRGVWSTMTQFMTYQQRLIELMIGKKLTGVEKARLFGTNLALFGLPTSAALFPVPGLSDKIKRDARENGYIVGDNFVDSFIMQGAMSSMLEIITGRHYNVGDRYGTKGLEWLDNALKSDQHVWDILGGASYQTLINFITEADGFWRAMISGAKTVMGIQHDNEVYPMTLDIMLKPFREISSINTATRFMEAVHTANWYSKQGRKLEEGVSVPEALLMSLTGLQRQSTEDIFTYSEMRKGEKQYQEQTRRLFFNQMSQYYQAAANNDFEQGKANFQQAQALLIQRGYPINEVLKLYRQALEANRALSYTIPWSYYTKSVPEGRRQNDNLDQLRRFLLQREREH